MRADDNGERGAFALYSLLCRHAKVNSLPNCQLADEELYEYKKDSCGGGGAGVSSDRGFAFWLKSTPEKPKVLQKIEKHKVLQKILRILALIGTCMVIGDGVPTPALSVFSAISGFVLSMSKEHHAYVEVPVACIILVGLFALQHYVTHRVGFLFAPIVITWLFCISGIGLYNIFFWNPQIYRALYPIYALRFVRKTQTRGLMALGGVLLSITGSEAMFANLGHFSQLSFQIAFTSVVYPSLILAYMGQAAYLSRHHDVEHAYHFGFYVSVPENLRWPVLVIAVFAAVVGSQAIITGTFSIIKQCSALNCFPRVKVVHTSSKIHGQIYIPEINWLLMLLTLAVTIGFRNTQHLGHASGLAVITVMLVTTCLMSLVIVLCWHQNVLFALTFVLFFGTIESLFFSASLTKFLQGAWVPIALAFVFMTVMYFWHFGTLKKYEFDVQNKVSINWLLGIGPSIGIVRVRGVGLIHTDLVSGIPVIFSHFVTNLPAFHQILVFLCIKHVPVPHVRPEERFLVGRVGPKNFRLYRCIVRYGYRDIHKDDVEFENDLLCSIAEFIRTGSTEISSNDEIEKIERMTVVGTYSSQTISRRGENGDNNNNNNVDNLDSEETSSELKEIKSPQVIELKKQVRFSVPESPKIDLEAKEELEEVIEAREAGIAYIIGHSYMKAKPGSSTIKKIAINFVYEFLRRNSRAPSFVLGVPHASSLEVGMMYQV